MALRPPIGDVATKLSSREIQPLFAQQPSKRRKRRKAANPAQPANAPIDNTTSLIVDEPGKLVGGSLSDVVNKQKKDQDESLDMVETLKKGVEDRFGKRPQDASDAFDYGFGNLVKQTVYLLAGALIIFDIYINSPFFERAAPSPVITAISEEIQKTTNNPSESQLDPEAFLTST
eukprot:CAMPEP_0197314058 /NCGR_PEP_ID=MMETSP0891-20130614/31911_1 /TAXON_ID=44058 ORGANISM="Aureoumbra lagunensis, Strain CCMP1510" /NCGR_SAMPLE_ID=MMETSP0891 /ASSEMBLY_ACC=CAM_ASM_000534 /LENGTH=174 /DNA_ID=CAMNT_0042802307 /DNA_START=1 /DNA_END=525 /DNA_ORIENTATION=-